MTLQIGTYAPDFTLYDTEKNKVTLSEQKGHQVVLLFFPLAFSSVCTAEVCSVRDRMNIYEKVNARVFGISVDSLYSLGRFKEEEHLNFSLLSDFNKEVSKAYGVLYENFSYDMKGVSKRAAFVIDRDGKIQLAEVLENPGLQPDYEKIQVKLRELAE